MRQALGQGWEVARADRAARWLAARVPGTVADALAAAGEWSPGEPEDLDAHDWLFRCRFTARDERPVRLRLGGVATHATVELNGTPLLSTESMFLAYEADVSDGLRDGENELLVRCHALGPMLATPRKPRARWRTRLVDNGLRWHRTMLLGRAPGIAPSPAAVGPWRPVSIEYGPPAPHVMLLPRLDEGEGVLEVRTTAEVEIAFDGQAAVRTTGGEIPVGAVEAWWPHTHGEQRLYDVVVRWPGGETTRRVGFRRLAVREDGFGLVVNGTEIFARGAVWTPGAKDPRAVLETARSAGLNIVRVVGTGAYEDAAFHDLCDELGMLVWQDFMFANLDYPIGDEAFRGLVEAEARQALAEVAGRPSLVVLCGNSEVEQQVAMLGLDPALGRGELFGELLPRLVEEAGADVPYVPSAPSGGALPFRPDQGVAHWFGVGGYRRPLSDTRAAGVRFAAECLALSNLGDGPGADDPRGVPADNGADWTFADVRDYYVRELYGAEPEPRLGRQVTGEVMAEVFGEWRRAASPCAGGIVLWLRDLRPGAGWGLLDESGRPKAALGRLRGVLAPLAVWTTDEGMSGIAVHAANDGAAPVDGELRIALYAEGERLVGEGAAPVRLAGRSQQTWDLEGLLGRFADVSWAYRFGPPAQDTVVARLHDAAGEVLAESFRFPVGPPHVPCSAEELGLQVRLVGDAVELVSRRVVHGARVLSIAGPAGDDAFCLEPGRVRRVRPAGEAGLVVTAVNLAGEIVPVAS